jgi:hypothetical protein
VSIFGPLLLALVAALVVPATPPGAGRSRWLVVTAALFVLVAVTQTIYVASEDDYRDVGVSRWSTYNVKAAAVTAVATALLTAALALAGRWRPRLAGLVPLLGVVAVGAGLVARLQMTN